MLIQRTRIILCFSKFVEIDCRVSLFHSEKRKTFDTFRGISFRGRRQKGFVFNCKQEKLCTKEGREIPVQRTKIVALLRINSVFAGEMISSFKEKTVH